MAQVDVGAQVITELGEDDCVAVRVSCRVRAGGALDVLGEDLGCLVAESAGQVVRAGGDPEREALFVVLAMFEFGESG